MGHDKIDMTSKNFNVVYGFLALEFIAAKNN